MNSYDDNFLAAVMDQLIDVVCVVDVQGRFLFVSAAATEVFGYTPAEMLGRRMIELVHPDDRARTLNAVVEIVAGTHRPNFENRYLRKDGSTVHLMWTARWSNDRQIRVAVARDVTEHRRAETLRAAVYAVSEAAHESGDLPGLFERIHRIVATLLPASGLFVALFELGELSFPYHADAHSLPPAPRPLDDRLVSARIVRTGKAVLLRPEDRLEGFAHGAPDVGADTVDWLGVPLKSRNGTAGALVVQNHAGERRYGQEDLDLLQFVSTQIAAAIERKQWETRLQHAAQHDPLTGLPNRALLHDRLHKALDRARRDGSHLAVLYVDLDRFKQINDRLGHAAGDLVLKETAWRLKSCLRESDTVARIGGDEFVVLLGDLPRAEDAAPVADTILAALCRPFEIYSQPVQVAPSVGWAATPDDGSDAQRLVQAADEAMYAAKRAGGQRVYSAARLREAPPAKD